MTNEELVKAYQAGDKEAMTMIVENNRGLVNLLVNRYYELSEISYLDRDDLEQLGYIGLIEAAKGFDPSMGFKFTTYATTAIKGHISRGLKFTSPWESKYKKDSNLAQVVSAHQLLPGADDMTYMDMIEDPAAVNDFHNLICTMDQEILRDDLFNMLRCVFSDKDHIKNAIILKYGLNGHAYTMKEIGEIYSVSAEKVQQWTVSGLRKIRSSSAGHVLSRKYRVEYGLDHHLPRLTRLEYKDPQHYLIELEQLRKALSW